MVLYLHILYYESYFNHSIMKNLLIIILAFFVLTSCEEKELIEVAPTSTNQTVEKSAATNEYAENADFSYHIEDEDDLTALLATLSADDVVVILNSTAYVFTGLAPLWLDPGTIDGKKVCEGLGGLAFGKCVLKHVKAGDKVLVWMDNNGNYHASV